MEKTRNIREVTLDGSTIYITNCRYCGKEEKSLWLKALKNNINNHQASCKTKQIKLKEVNQDEDKNIKG